MSVLGFASIMDAYQRNFTIHQMQSDIAKLRSQALLNGCSQVLEIASDGSRYMGRASSSCFSGDYDAEDLRSFSYNLPSTVRLAASADVQINSRGFVVDSVGQPSDLPVGLLCRGIPCGNVTLSMLGVLQ
jgi:hypothetical protein